jgi:hypothetical protein
MALLGARRPGWYQPAAIDYTRLVLDKADAINQFDAISAALNGGAPIDIVLSEAQVNRWIAARAEIWPDSDLVRLDPLERPVLDFLGPEGLRVAAAVHARGMRAVISIELDFQSDRDELIIEWTGVRVGDLRVPRGVVSGIIDRFVPDQADPFRNFKDGVSRVPNRWVWPNGKQPFRIDRVTFMADEARLRLAPL